MLERWTVRKFADFCGVTPNTIRHQMKWQGLNHEEISESKQDVIIIDELAAEYAKAHGKKLEVSNES